MMLRKESVDRGLAKIKGRARVRPYDIGERVGRLKILDYIEFGSWNHARRCKTDPLRLSKKYHWFLTGCDCGREESAHYEQIKNRQQCSRCVRNKNSTIHVGLNAATWKPPESIETGPENWPRVRYPDA